MIKDEKQYKFSQQIARDFEKSIAAMDRDEDRRKNDPDGWELIRGSLNCHLDKLNSEIAEYERLTSHDRHQPILLKLEDIDDFAKILIKARMAAKLSQKELADLSGLTEEQIGRYEDNDYQDASFLDVLSVISALEIRVQQAEFLVPLDTLRRTPVTKEELLGSRRRTQSQEAKEIIEQV